MPISRTRTPRVPGQGPRAQVGLGGGGTSTSSTATLAFDAGLDFQVGDWAVVAVAADNNGTNGASSTSSVTDVGGNTYSNRHTGNQDPGAASEGVTLTWWTAPITTALAATDDITVNFSPNTTSKAALVWRVRPGYGVTLTFQAAGGAEGTTGSPATGTGARQVGDIVFGAVAREHNSATTADSDVLDAAWSSQAEQIASTGTAATSITLASQHKIVTGTGDQTYNPTATSADVAIGVCILRPT